jgi:preprotein translocase subunit SecG
LNGRDRNPGAILVAEAERSWFGDGHYHSSSHDCGDEFGGSRSVGTASGINNAIDRVAGVLAIAVLGIVMVNAFASRLDHDLAALDLPPSVAQEIHSNETKLAGLQLPSESLDPGMKAAIQKSIGKAFVFGFRIVLLICATLSFASAAVAWLIIPAKPLFS